MWLTGPVALRHVGSSQTRARTRVPCIGRQILNHCATREAPGSLLILGLCICCSICLEHLHLLPPFHPLSVSHPLLQEVLPDTPAGSGIPQPRLLGSPISALTNAGLSLSVTGLSPLLGPGRTGLDSVHPPPSPRSLQQRHPSVRTWVSTPTSPFVESLG